MIQDKVSRLFQERGIATFAEAGKFVANLKYGRNANKEDLTTLFSDNCGTCSTKHALLKLWAEEQGRQDIKLMLGIFRMNAQNTPKAGKILTKYNLPYLPEAHNYLKCHEIRLDFTLPEEKALQFENDLLEEIEIEVFQITAFKVQYHKDFLQKWLLENPTIIFDLETIWKIREECIEALSNPT